MPTHLSEPLVRDALTRLVGWSGDAGTIHRDFALDAASRQHMTAEIQALSGSTHHAITVAATSTGIGVTLATADVDGVSELDIAVASRLNDLFSGTSAGHLPQQRQASVNAPAATSAAAVGVEEHRWWDGRDRLEPVMGVPATSSGVMPVPLPGSDLPDSSLGVSDGT
jgi:4a-hydroxytetrahydrobiopterin dehydratase